MKTSEGNKLRVGNAVRITNKSNVFEERRGKITRAMFLKREEERSPR